MMKSVRVTVELPQAETAKRREGRVVVGAAELSEMVEEVLEEVGIRQGASSFELERLESIFGGEQEASEAGDESEGVLFLSRGRDDLAKVEPSDASLGSHGDRCRREEVFVGWILDLRVDGEVSDELDLAWEDRAREGGERLSGETVEEEAFEGGESEAQKLGDWEKNGNRRSVGVVAEVEHLLRVASEGRLAKSGLWEY
jgi:hypothetical protein